MGALGLVLGDQLWPDIGRDVVLQEASLLPIMRLMRRKYPRNRMERKRRKRDIDFKNRREMFLFGGGNDGVNPVPKVLASYGWDF
jgi:hypothetical protein